MPALRTAPSVALRALCASAVALIAVVALASPASATTPCAKKILSDWLDNSRIDGTYQLHCYGEAIDAIPSDIRPYSNAEDVIRSALLAAGGRRLAITEHPPGGKSSEGPLPVPEDAASASSGIPLPLLVLTGMSLALLAAGGVGYVSRRRRAGDVGPSDDDRLT